MQLTESASTTMLGVANPRYDYSCYDNARRDFIENASIVVARMPRTVVANNHNDGTDRD